MESFFFSNEGDPIEPVHIHIQKGSALAKFWIEPEVVLSDSWGMSAKELRSVKVQIEKNANKIKEHWNEYFGL